MITLHFYAYYLIPYRSQPAKRTRLTRFSTREYPTSIRHRVNHFTGSLSYFLLIIYNYFYRFASTTSSENLTSHQTVSLLEATRKLFHQNSKQKLTGIEILRLTMPNPKKKIQSFMTSVNRKKKSPWRHSAVTTLAPRKAVCRQTQDSFHLIRHFRERPKTFSNGDPYSLDFVDWFCRIHFVGFRFSQSLPI